MLLVIFAAKFYTEMEVQLHAISLMVVCIFGNVNTLLTYNTKKLDL